MEVLSKALIKKSEENAVTNGIFLFRELMFRAGRCAAKRIINEYKVINKKICVVCGTGNNAGDGMVIASQLSEYGADVTVVIPFGPPKTENALFYFNKLNNVKVKNQFINDNYFIIIDALFGIGLNRPLDAKTDVLINQINSCNSIIVSVDIPSGVETDKGIVFSSAIKADITISFISYKPCFLLPPGSDYCGKIYIEDIGVEITDISYNIIEQPIFKKRRHNSHKGDFGTAVLICGSYGMAGAAILSAKAALRSGAGIVKCFICDSIYQAFTSSVPEAVCIPVKQSLSGTLPSFIDIPDKCNSLLIGCGIGQSEDTSDLVKKIISSTKTPIVIDADGINMLLSCIDIIKKCKAPCILTPHPGEMARLCNMTISEVESDRVTVARDFATENQCIVVLKGANTIVAEPSGKISFNITGNPGMSTGGSGDVLSGMIVSLLAQGYSAEDSAKYAVFLHGKAGDQALIKRNERSLLPSDLIEEL